VIDQVVHPVETAQQRRLSATGRSDECGDVFFEYLEIDIL
jgi:hypothetical protein